MVKGDKVRLNHELLIWCGFTLANGVWSSPDGVTVDNGVPFFPESLDACKEWLMPTLEYCCLVKPEHPSYGGQWRVEVKRDGRGATGNENEPAIAFCLAIQKLIGVSNVKE